MTKEELIKRLEDIEWEDFQRYRTYLQNIESAHSYNSLSNAEFLQKLNVLINQKITIAGLLVFGKEDCITSAMQNRE
jgi:predicted HTH transcriptional regulator